MNDMRKLMETVEKLNEGWDPGAIADAIYDEFNTEGSPLQKVAQESNEPYRAMIYAYADATGLFNARAIDGSEIWHSIVDSLEDRMWEGVSGDDIKRAQLGEDERTKGYEVWHAGPVEVKMGMGEVALYHGHGEQIFLSDDEWSMFINAIHDGGRQ